MLPSTRIQHSPARSFLSPFTPAAHPLRAKLAITACEEGGSSPLVRAPGADAFFIQRVLDLGADGLVVPQTPDAAGAGKAVGTTAMPDAQTRRRTSCGVNVLLYGAATGLVGQAATAGLELYRDFGWSPT